MSAAGVLDEGNAINTLIKVPVNFYDHASLSKKQRNAKYFSGKILKKRKADGGRIAFDVQTYDCVTPFYLHKHPKAKAGDTHKYLTRYLL